MSKELTTSNNQTTTPAQLLSQAIEKGMGVAELEKLVDLQERWEANKARKLFFESFTKWQSIAPDIRKSKKVAFDTKTGGRTEYSFAPLADIARQINKPLKENDLSYRWEIKDEGEKIFVTFLVSHIDGHTERTTMMVTPDLSGSKNAIQARGSAIEYAKRYTLIGGLGLSTADSDVDGAQPTQQDVDKLHAEFMALYNQVYQKNPEKYGKYLPDNWKGERTAKNYVKAIGEMRKFVFDENQKQA